MIMSKVFEVPTAGYICKCICNMVADMSVPNCD